MASLNHYDSSQSRKIYELHGNKFSALRRYMILHQWLTWKIPGNLGLVRSGQSKRVDLFPAIAN
jgi:hypothetical protein